MFILKMNNLKGKFKKETKDDHKNAQKDDEMKSYILDSQLVNWTKNKKQMIIIIIFIIKHIDSNWVMGKELMFKDWFKKHNLI